MLNSVAIVASDNPLARSFYAIEDPTQGAGLLRDIDVGSKGSAPFEVRHVARTLRNWFEPIVAWPEAKVSNGPTEGMNNLLKRAKRVAFCFANFENFPHPRPALRGQAQLQDPGLDGGHVRWLTPDTGRVTIPSKRVAD